MSHLPPTHHHDDPDSAPWFIALAIVAFVGFVLTTIAVLAARAQANPFDQTMHESTAPLERAEPEPPVVGGWVVDVEPGGVRQP